MFNLNCQRIEQRETIKNSCSLIKKLEWKSKGKPQSDLCAGKAGGRGRGWRVVLRLRLAHVTIRAMTKINTRLWPQPFTAGKWDEIGEWDAKTGTTAETGDGDEGGWGWSFYAPLGKYTGAGRCCSKACGLWGNIMSALITFCHVDNVEVLSPLPPSPARRVFGRKCRQKGKTSDWKTPPDIIATYSITQPNRAPTLRYDNESAHIS